jgi:chromosomal replication initiation ATPase DnaA
MPDHRAHGQKGVVQVNMQLHKIIGMVWAETSVSLAEMADTGNRHRTNVMARRLVVGLARDLTLCSFPEIQAVFDDAKGHSTQITRHDSHLQALKTDKAYSSIYWRIRRRLTAEAEAA